MENEFSVLVVDDNVVIRKTHKELLSKCGFNVFAVEDGEKAVDQFRSGKRFDIVFMDMEMPIKDGSQATRELRAMGVSSMIIGVTSLGQDHEKREFMNSGLNDCYVKPLTESTITSLLHKLKNK